MEAGVHLHPVQAVRLIAEEKPKPEQEPVQIRLPNTVEVTAMVHRHKARVVTHTIVQVMILRISTYIGMVAILDTSS